MKTYQEFKDSYVEPTKGEYYLSFLKLPTWEEAVSWERALGRNGPMNEEDFERHIELIGVGDRKKDEAEANHMNRLRCRTTLAWYIDSWFSFIVRPFRSSFEGYKEGCYENAYNNWSYSQEY